MSHSPSGIVVSDVRDDIWDAQREFVSSLGVAGSWWTAAERVAIASVVRMARGFESSAPWETPSALDVDVSTYGIPEAAVDAAWRLTNHPGTLTSDWYEAIVASLPWPRLESERRYVELVGIVAVMNAVDRFAGALSLEQIALPSPDSQPVPRHPGVEAAVDLHWVPTTAERGPNVFTSLSSVPAAFADIAAISESHYVPLSAVTGNLSWNRGTLSRPQIELVAATTSLHNECFY